MQAMKEILLLPIPLAILCAAGLFVAKARRKSRLIFLGEDWRQIGKGFEGRRPRIFHLPTSTASGPPGRDQFGRVLMQGTVELRTTSDKSSGAFTLSFYSRSKLLDSRVIFAKDINKAGRLVSFRAYLPEMDQSKIDISANPR
jgi:hypothetical protein